jgi:hypothetical protein
MGETTFYIQWDDPEVQEYWEDHPEELCDGTMFAPLYSPAPAGSSQATFHQQSSSLGKAEEFEIDLAGPASSTNHKHSFVVMPDATEADAAYSDLHDLKGGPAKEESALSRAASTAGHALAGAMV